ncbi:MAG: hypothetical protein HW405_113 [Candidatus Berkelbacteria bacterium]|nr:hypothetical protein [Candidatus Berkelbacteria bacterium]
MKILMLLKYPLFGSGSGTYVRKLSEKLKILYPDDQLAIFCPDLKNKINGINLYYYKMPFHAASTGHPDWPDAKLYSNLSRQNIDELYIESFNQIIKVVNDFKPDVIHVHHALYFSWIANYLSSIYGIFYVVTTHGTELLTASENKSWIPLTRDALCRASMITAVSGDTKKWLLRIYGRYGQHGIINKMRIIPGGVDYESYSRLEPIKIINKKYNLGGKRVVIFSGKLTYKKGVQYLIKAALKIKAEIFIIGGGEEESKLKALVDELKVKNVHFMGYFGANDDKELKEFYRRADVLVFPSIWEEPLGLVALEAMASSTPVVASKKGGIPLAVKNNVNGFLVRARSAKAIAEKVNFLLKNEDIRKKMGEEARKIVEEKFNWTKIAQRFHEYYEHAFRTSQERLKRMKLPVDIEQERIEIKGSRLDLKEIQNGNRIR